MPKAPDGSSDPVVMLRALAHPVRLGILRALALRPETCACDFTELFSVRQPTISQHLKVLREAGLVQTRRRGTQICYSIHPGSLEHLQQTIADLQPELSLQPSPTRLHPTQQHKHPHSDPQPDTFAGLPPCGRGMRVGSEEVEPLVQPDRGPPVRP